MSAAASSSSSSTLSPIITIQAEHTLNSIYRYSMIPNAGHRTVFRTAEPINRQWRKEPISIIVFNMADELLPYLEALLCLFVGIICDRTYPADPAGNRKKYDSVDIEVAFLPNITQEQEDFLDSHWEMVASNAILFSTNKDILSSNKCRMISSAAFPYGTVTINYIAPFGLPSKTTIM